MNNSTKKNFSFKKILIICGIILLILSFELIGFGCYYNYLSKPKIIVAQVIDTMNENLQKLLAPNQNLPVSNNFTITSNITTQANSDIIFNSEYEEMQRFYNNLSNTSADITFKQDTTNKKLLLEMNSTLKNTPLFQNKFYIENATSYYYLNNYTSNYINNGNNNYFENLSSDKTLQSNFQYLMTFIINSFKNNLKEEYINKYSETTTYFSNQENLTKLNIRLDNKLIKEIAKNILQDLKNDSEANKILTNFNRDFKNTKINNKAFLASNESYTINIYTDKYNKVKKIELIHLNENEEKRMTYEIGEKENILYFIENDHLNYIMNITKKEHSLNAEIFNSNDQKIGNIEFDNSHNSLIFNIYINDEDNKLDFKYHQNYSKITKKSYNKTIEIAISRIIDKIDIMDFTINVESTYNQDVNINEDLTDSLLENSLSSTEKDKISNYVTDIFQKLAN